MHLSVLGRACLVSLCTGAIALSVTSCGSKNSDSSDKKSNEGSNLKDDSESTDTSGKLTSGKYRLSAAKISGNDAAGNEIKSTNLQVTGPGAYRIIESLGDGEYKMTLTGDAVLNSGNQKIGEFKCQGAQDVVTFTLSDSGQAQDVSVVEAGCPTAGESGVDNSTYRFENIKKNSFEVIQVATEGGARVVFSQSFSLVTTKK
jgi:hypothetical protein